MLNYMVLQEYGDYAGSIEPLSYRYNSLAFDFVVHIFT